MPLNAAWSDMSKDSGEQKRLTELANRRPPPLGSPWNRTPDYMKVEQEYENAQGRSAADIERMQLENELLKQQIEQLKMQLEQMRMQRETPMPRQHPKPPPTEMGGM